MYMQSNVLEIEILPPQLELDYGGMENVFYHLDYVYSRNARDNTVTTDTTTCLHMI